MYVKAFGHTYVLMESQRCLEEFHIINISINTRIRITYISKFPVFIDCKFPSVSRHHSLKQRVLTLFHLVLSFQLLSITITTTHQTSQHYYNNHPSLYTCAMTTLLLVSLKGYVYTVTTPSIV